MQAFAGIMLLALLLSSSLCQGRIQQRESHTWHAGSAPASGRPSSPATSEEASVARCMTLLRQHPAVHSLQDLGMWSTQHFGRLPPSVAAKVAIAAAPEGAGVARKLAAAAWSALKATVPHGGAPAVLLQHWWRLRCTEQEPTDQHIAAAEAVGGTAGAAMDSMNSSSPGVISSMELRGVGTAKTSLVGCGLRIRLGVLVVCWIMPQPSAGFISAAFVKCWLRYSWQLLTIHCSQLCQPPVMLQDWVYHHTLTPRLPASTTALEITEHGAGSSTNSWTLQQSDIIPGVQAVRSMQHQQEQPPRLHRSQHGSSKWTRVLARVECSGCCNQCMYVTEAYAAQLRT